MVREVGDGSGDAEMAEKMLRLGASSLSTLRKRFSVMKVPLALTVIRKVLEESEKIVVFAHHVEVVKQLVDALMSLGCPRDDLWLPP